MRSLFRRAFCLALLTYTPTLFAQPKPHFSDCRSATGRSASLIIPLEAPRIVHHPTKTTPVSVGAELAVFTPDGVCAGTLTWNGEAAALAVWEDDPVTPDKDGFMPGDTLIYRLWDTSTRGELTASSVRYDPPSPPSGRFASDAVYLVAELAFSRPQEEDEPSLAFALEPNYPNPFTSRTTFRFSVPEPIHVRLELYDLLGRRVASLVDERLSAGWHERSLDAAGLSGGTYVARLTAGSHAATQRITLIR
jgi:hypothetical protein